MERDITKYLEEGKGDYKEVPCLPLSYLIKLFSCYLIVLKLFNNLKMSLYVVAAKGV